MFIKRDYIKRHLNTLFVFGDNDLRIGLGGMAKEFRGEANSTGIRTKKAPSNKEPSFYTDREYKKNREKILEDVEGIILSMSFYEFLYIPDTLGMGLADLQNRAPKTLKRLQFEIEDLKSIYKG